MEHSNRELPAEASHIHNNPDGSKRGPGRAASGWVDDAYLGKKKYKYWRVILIQKELDIIKVEIWGGDVLPTHPGDGEAVCGHLQGVFTPPTAPIGSNSRIPQLRRAQSLLCVLHLRTVKWGKLLIVQRSSRVHVWRGFEAPAEY